MDENRTCKSCQQDFIITDLDRPFYKKLDVPEPTFCPDCRLQRRLSFRIERNLYWRNCDLTNKKMLSVFSPESPYKVYHIDAWYGDRWNAKDYGRPFDFNRPFFEQLSELMKKVPLLSLNAVGLQNCDYVNQVGYSKNCYLIIEADYNEDCMYSYRIFYSKTSMDCTELFRSERCYECVDCESCFDLKFSQLCRQCSESAFLYDCRGCSNCFGCTGLRRKNFCMFNEQLTKEEYGRRMKIFDFSNPEHMAIVRKQFEEVKMKYPRKAYIGEMNENVSGNYIYESKDCSECFGVRGGRDLKYCQLVRSAKDCMDYFVWGNNAERIYECECCGQNIQSLKFCCDCWDGVHDLTYCFQCVLSTSDCFGCIGLQHGKYSILNKEYPKPEYETLKAKIIEHMKKTGEWGEFFPSSISPYAYNETVAQEYFPMEKEDGVKKGLAWRDNLPFTTGKETISWDKIPNRIQDIPDTILNEIFACQNTGKNFRITEQELKFYRSMNLPLPRLHPDERHRLRMLLRNPRKLFRRTCSKCKNPIETSYAPDSPGMVYCEKCYLEAVY